MHVSPRHVTIVSDEYDRGWRSCSLPFLTPGTRRGYRKLICGSVINCRASRVNTLLSTKWGFSVGLLFAIILLEAWYYILSFCVFQDRKSLSEEYEGELSGRESWWRTYIRVNWLFCLPFTMRSRCTNIFCFPQHLRNGRFDMGLYSKTSYIKT